MSEKFEVKDGLKIPSGKQLELNTYSLSGVSNDINLADASQGDVPTEYAVKSYIDANNQWTISDGSNQSTIESGDTLQISGTSSEIDVVVSGDSFTVGLPDAVTIETSLTTAALTATGDVTLADGAALATNAAPTDDAHIANKKYVDDQLGSTAMSAATDTGNMDPIDLDSEVLSLVGGEGMNVTHSGNTVTFTGEEASASNKGVASFNSTDFLVTGGDVTLAKDPTITIDGDVTGSATMTNLASATITTTIGANAVEMSMLSAGVLPTDISVASANLVDGTIVNDDISNATIANAKLVNDSVSFGGVSLDLGQVDATPAFNLSDATAYPGDSSLVTTGVLNSGSISTGFGNIDNGTSTLAAGNTTITGSISATGLLTVGTVADGTSMNSTAAPTDDAHIANKKYVDDQLGATALSGASDSGTLEVDLDSQSLSIVGTTNEIETSATGQTLTIGLPEAVTIVTGTFTNEAEFNGGINCDGDLTMELNGIIGSADNMLLQADDETAHTFTGTDKMALQALNGIEMVNNVKFSADIESNIIPDGDSTRSLGDATNHWSATYSDEVVLEHGKTSSFSVTPGDASATAVMSFAHADFKSAKVSMNVTDGTDYTAREVIVVCKNDGSSPKLVEYGVLNTGNNELGALTVALNGSNIELKVASASGLPCTGVVTLSE